MSLSKPEVTNKPSQHWMLLLVWSGVGAIGAGVVVGWAEMGKKTTQNGKMKLVHCRRIFGDLPDILH